MTISSTESTDGPHKERRVYQRRGKIWLSEKQLILLLTKDEFLYMSEKFFLECCTMDCAGCPGPIIQSYVKATLQVVKIGIFLLFVFLVVMAYGSTYYISPANHLFVTLVSGLVPLIIRNVFCLVEATSAETVNTANYKFEAQLNEKIQNFKQMWDVSKMTLTFIESNIRRDDPILAGDEVDLILHLNGTETKTAEVATHATNRSNDVSLPGDISQHWMEDEANGKDSANSLLSDQYHN